MAKDLEFKIKARDQTRAAFDSARAKARAFNGDLDLTARRMQAATFAAKAFAAAFSVAAVTRFSSAIRDAVGEASQLAKTADRVGISTDNFQAMIFGFGQAGVEAQTLTKALELWNRKVAEAASFGNRLADILKANNVSLRDQNGEIRSSLELLRVYADLMANAATAQERALLSQEAFERGGAAMIVALRDGAAGVDELMGRTEAAGGVIEEELLRRAEELDDQFDRITRTVEINLKNALIGVADVMATIVGHVSSIEEFLGNLGNAQIFQQINRLLGVTQMDVYEGSIAMGLEPPLAPRGDRVGPMTPTERINQAFGARPEPVQRTIIPEKPPRGGGRRSSAAAARSQADAFERVIEALRLEQEMLGLNDTQQRILTQQRRAGVEASSEQGQAIAALVTQIEAETERLAELERQNQAVANAAQWLGTSVLDSLFAVAEGAQSAEDAIRDLGLQILKAYTYALLFDQGPFAGLFGGGGGLLGGLLGGLFGARAIGGPVNPWGEYIVGENGPERLSMGPYRGTITPMAAPATQSGPVEIIVGVSTDSAGNLTPFVESVSRRQAGQVVRQAAPAIVATATQSSMRRIRDVPGSVR